MNSLNSQQSWIDRAQKVLPTGGFGNYDPGIIIRNGLGSRVWDQDGNEYIDFLIGSGPMLVGHCHPEVMEVVQQQLNRGTTFFANNTKGIELAEEICRAVACADKVRYVSTGGEADMYAMRLARAHTGRNKIMKFEGGYHGMSAEGLMSLAPTKLEDFPNAVPDSAGIPHSVRENMIIAPFNNIDAAVHTMTEYGDDIAAVIVEPMQRLIPPMEGFLETLRTETQKRGIVLIFDEIVTGFRLAYGGAQEYYGVIPDLCTLGKAIGGGFPLAAIAGNEAIMAHFDKSLVGDEGFTLQIGTLSGNPVAAAAGLKTMEILQRPDSYQQLRENGQEIMTALENSLSAAGITHKVVGDQVMFDVVFTSDQVCDYRDTIGGNTEITTRFNKQLRQNGILKSPNKYYPSLALSDVDLEQSVKAIKKAASAISE